MPEDSGNPNLFHIMIGRIAQFGKNIIGKGIEKARQYFQKSHTKTPEHKPSEKSTAAEAKPQQPQKEGGTEAQQKAYGKAYEMKDELKENGLGVKGEEVNGAEGIPHGYGNGNQGDGNYDPYRGRELGQPEGVQEKGTSRGKGMEM